MLPASGRSTPEEAPWSSHPRRLDFCPHYANIAMRTERRHRDGQPARILRRLGRRVGAGPLRLPGREAAALGLPAHRRGLLPYDPGLLREGGEAAGPNHKPGGFRLGARARRLGQGAAGSDHRRPDGLPVELLQVPDLHGDRDLEPLRQTGAPAHLGEPSARPQRGGDPPTAGGDPPRALFRRERA